MVPYKDKQRRTWYCKDCDTQKTEFDFSGPTAWYCKECMARRASEYYHKNKTRLEYKRQKAKILAYQYLREHPCIDCGEECPVLLQFDHVGTKTVCVSTMIAKGYNWAIIEQEINECVVRCVTCHTLKTARDFNWVMLQLWEEEHGSKTLSE